MTVKGETKKVAMAALAALCAVLSHFGAMAANTVAATDGDIGKIIGADGVVYASVAEAENAETTAYAMIAYINSEEAFGLAIAVGDAGDPCTWDDAKSAAATWAASRPAEFGAWRLLSVDEWFAVFREFYGYSEGEHYYTYGDFRDSLTDCGAADMQNGRYWTSEESESEARTCDFQTTTTIGLPTRQRPNRLAYAYVLSSVSSLIRRVAQATAAGGMMHTHRRSPSPATARWPTMRFRIGRPGMRI